jgi:hypothetical protein
MSHGWNCAFSIVLIGLAFTTARAQDAATGAIHGAVTDPSGSRIQQATVVVVNTATGARYSATSDGEGHFAIELLPPGDYSARVTAARMSPQVTPQLHVEVGAAIEIEFHLTIAGAERMSQSLPLPPWSKLNRAPSPRCWMSVRLQIFR